MTRTNPFRRQLGSLALAATALALAAPHAGATATVTIVNVNAAGVGFNDPTPVAPVGGNPGTTLGAQRLFVFQYAANIWGGILTSSVPIKVNAQFAAQTCTATSATLGSTGAGSLVRDFAGADYPATWYVQSLANRLAGADLDTARADMNTTFNLTLDSGTCLGGSKWYYGIDGNEGTDVELLPVVLHELAHGLGFATSTSGSTGNFNSGYPSVYDRFLMDNTLGLHWYQMTAAQRKASAISTDKLVWDGYYGTTAADAWLGKRPRLLVNAPSGIAGPYAANGASFGAALTAAGVTGDVVLVQDTSTVTSPTDGCDPIVNAADLAGKVALIDRGTCTFVIKAKNAQNAGAIAVIIANNTTGTIAPGGSDPTITIPVIAITQADGNTLKANLASGVNVTIGLDPVLLAGADAAGRPLMYAPSTFASGSSVSHWDVSMTPNTLMEPAINNDLHDNVDITPALFRDIGWFPVVTATTLALFTAEGREDGVLLRWRFSDPQDVVAMRLERAASAPGPWSEVPVSLTQSGDQVSALDTTAPAGATSYYRIAYTDAAGHALVTGLAFAQRAGALAGRVVLAAPSPNPSARGAVVNFQIPRIQSVRLTVTDASGRAVRTLHDGMLMPGQYTKVWDGRTDGGATAAPGIYFLHLDSPDGGTLTRRLAIVR